ncbi:OmpH family outer membrane protein [Pseudophaeobacter flagellatus]|uniref:OmpH family outer membrane protein n=1 Tax=Pseudophaeobacter flagellatus TaxID=2899119 RepID=UPI0038CD1735
MGLALFVPFGGASPGLAQQTPPPAGFELGRQVQLGTPQSGLLTIQPDRLFSESLFGERIAQEIEAEGAVLTAENRNIEAELRAEEQDLTQRRSGMEPEAFRRLADAFDRKVQETRVTQDRKLREISQLNETAQREFFAASLPILEQIMRETGAGAILDHSTVFLSADAVDITDLAISRIDKVLGDGQDQDRSPDGQ